MRDTRAMRARLRLTSLLVAVVATGLLAPLAVAPAAATEPYAAAIWNGRRVAEGDHAEVTAIQRPDTTAPADCTATLVRPRWVLTAAHCVFDIPAAPLTLGLGGVDVREPFREVYTSRLHVVHPRWDPRSVRFDFAMVRLPESSEITPAELATVDDEALWQPGVEANIVGWGSVDGADRGGGRLREAFIRLAADEDCAEVHPNYDSNSMLCGDATDSDACRGDSGGPLFAIDGERRIQMGVTSFGADCDISVVGVYAWVPAARSWIDEVVAAGRPARFATDAGLVASSERISVGRVVTLRGRLFRLEDGRALIRQPVEILRRPRGSTTWRVAANRRTNFDGTVRFRDEPRRDMEYALRHSGGPATRPTRSPRVVVRVVR